MGVRPGQVNQKLLPPSKERDDPAAPRSVLLRLNLSLRPIFPNDWVGYDLLWFLFGLDHWHLFWFRHSRCLRLLFDLLCHFCL